MSVPPIAEAHRRAGRARRDPRQAHELRSRRALHRRAAQPPAILAEDPRGGASAGERGARRARPRRRLDEDRCSPASRRARATSSSKLMVGERTLVLRAPSHTADEGAGLARREAAGRPREDLLAGTRSGRAPKSAREREHRLRGRSTSISGGASPSRCRAGARPER